MSNINPSKKHNASDMSQISAIAKKLSLKRVFLDWVQKIFYFAFAVAYVAILVFLLSFINTLFNIHQILGVLGVIALLILAISVPYDFVRKNEIEKQVELKETLTLKIAEDAHFSKKELKTLKRKIRIAKFKYNRQIKKRAKRVLKLMKFDDENQKIKDDIPLTLKIFKGASRFLNLGTYINIKTRKGYERVIANLRYGTVATKQEYLQYIYNKNIDNICSSKILNSSAVAFIVCSANENNKFNDFLVSFMLCFVITKQVAKIYGFRLGLIACFKETFNTMFDTVSYIDSEETSIDLKNEQNQNTVIQKEKKTLMEKLMNVLQKSVQTINLFTQNKILEGTSNALLVYRFSKKIQSKLNPAFYEDGEVLEEELSLLAEKCTSQVEKIADDYNTMEETNKQDKIDIN